MPEPDKYGRIHYPFHDRTLRNERKYARGNNTTKLTELSADQWRWALPDGDPSPMLGQVIRKERIILASQNERFPTQGREKINVFTEVKGYIFIPVRAGNTYQIVRYRMFLVAQDLRRCASPLKLQDDADCRPRVWSLDDDPAPRTRARTNLT